MCYLIEKTETASGPAAAIWEKTDTNAAIMALHSTFASAMANDAVLNCLCMVIEANGAVVRSEYWRRPVVPTVIPDSEPDPIEA